MFKIQNQYYLFFLFYLTVLLCSCQNSLLDSKTNVIVGANQIYKYERLIKNKNIGIIGNHTSVIFKENNSYTHLIDSLLSLNFKIKKIFAPEHGFRGSEPNGADIKDEVDIKTGIEIISLHGKNRDYGKIDDNDLSNIDILIFDIQDVGVRFYTHISVLHYAMEASARNSIPLIVLDRPNPNAHYIDGPVLNLKNKSFVGMHEVPIVYGLTIGEYATMINGEGWLGNNYKSELYIIELKNYDRNIVYNLPIKPSPNLPNKKSINLYPSLCLFEGTNVSIGRGTNMQFQIYGSPYLDKNLNTFSFKPFPNSGSKNPKHKGTLCFGKNLKNNEKLNEIDLSFIINAFNDSDKKNSFFNNYFIKLVGTENLKNQIINNISQNDIKRSWETKLNKFKLVREKYLIYKN